MSFWPGLHSIIESAQLRSRAFDISPGRLQSMTDLRDRAVRQSSGATTNLLVCLQGFGRPQEAADTISAKRLVLLVE
jgi:hypothetical protein